LRSSTFQKNKVIGLGILQRAKAKPHKQKYKTTNSAKSTYSEINSAYGLE